MFWNICRVRLVGCGGRIDGPGTTPSARMFPDATRAHPIAENSRNCTKAGAPSSHCSRVSCGIFLRREVFLQSLHRAHLAGLHQVDPEASPEHPRQEEKQCPAFCRQHKKRASGQHTAKSFEVWKQRSKDGGSCVVSS